MAHRDVPCFPERLDDDIAEANPVRFLAACVDELDLKSCGVHRAVPAATGRPGYAPSDLLNLYLYGDLSRLRSSRRLEQETHSKVALLWLLKKLRPDHKTRADCRKDNLTPIRQGCRPFTLRCKQWDLFGADLVALDGSTCRAVNATERNFTPAKLTKLLAPIDERVAASRKALERSDDQDNRGTVGGAHVDALAAQIEARTQMRNWNSSARRMARMIGPRRRPSVRRAPGSRSASTPSSSGGTSALMRRRLAGAVRSRRSARARKAGGG